MSNTVRRFRKEFKEEKRIEDHRKHVAKKHFEAALRRKDFEALDEFEDLD